MAEKVFLLGYAPGSTVPGLYSIDPTNGSAAFETGIGPAPAPGGMGYVGATLYMANAHIGSAFYYGVVDLSSHTFTATAAQTSTNWEGVAAPRNADFFYTIDFDHNEQLLKVTVGGSVTPIGTGVGLDLRGLTYDDVHSTIYAADYYNGSPNLYSIDPSTGAVTLIGSLGFAPASFGGDIPLAYDDRTQTLYAHNSVAHALYTVDTSTGLATEIGVDGQPIASLAIENFAQANWARAVDGDFDVAGNWKPAAVPDAWTDVSITRGGAADYTVTAHSAHEIQNLRIGADATLGADSLQVAGSAVVSGTLETSSDGSIDLQGDVKGSGILRIDSGGGTFEFGGSVSRLTHFQFDAGAGATATVVLDHSSEFRAEVSGLTAGDQFVFKDMSSTDRIKLTYAPNALDTGGVLKINDITEGIVAKIVVDGGHYATGDFTISDDGHGHALLQNHHLLV